MSGVTRRLLWDYQPLWILMELVLLGLLIVMDWGWLFNVRSTQVVQWFVPVFSVFTGLSFVAKLPAWRALPICPAERRRAQWWIWIGLPLARVILCMTLPLLVLTPLNGVHATPLQIAGLVETQLLAVLPLGAFFSAHGALRRRFGLAAGAFLVVPIFLVAGFFSPLQLADSGRLLWGAVAVLVLTIASYAGADRIAAVADRFSERREAPAAQPRAAARGWAALLPYFLGAIALATAATVVINYSMVRMLGPDLDANAQRSLPSMLIVTVLLLTGVGGQAAPYALRALRALPLGPASLTAVLQGFMMAMLLAPLGAIWGVMRASGLDTSLIPVYLVAMIPVAALRLPTNFRVGVQAGQIIAVLPVIPLIFLHFIPWARGPGFAAAMLLATIAIWIWTWWEVACGRAAYRARPLGVTRWRGGLN